MPAGPSAPSQQSRVQGLGGHCLGKDGDPHPPATCFLGRPRAQLPSHARGSPRGPEGKHGAKHRVAGRAGRRRDLPPRGGSAPAQVFVSQTWRVQRGTDPASCFVCCHAAPAMLSGGAPRGGHGPACPLSCCSCNTARAVICHSGLSRAGKPQVPGWARCLCLGDWLCVPFSPGVCVPFPQGRRQKVAGCGPGPRKGRARQRAD